ncbi:DoxX family protein [Chitinophaga sp. SYP-B3965]|uniref:DoxX family protein n=1 Tax=Chitinophaga sp. SYP-B3965 TaxID=2663120 RepID=UPI001299585B|nr:DoxX family protein [Chitinophaga sp. SYP-B3965]MRG43828.1 DoxX family protein [Chitinophaga sp. SYP-B3965]
MKKLKIIYWIFTGLLAVLMSIGSIPDIIMIPEARTLFQHLGYPMYLLPFVGVAKILGCIAIVVPGFNRLKEWAYAGLFFDITGALYSHITVGDPASVWLPLLIGYVLIFGSYIYHHKILKAKGLTYAI